MNFIATKTWTPLRHAALALLLWALATGLGLAQTLVPVPALSAHVMDQTGSLDSAALQALEAKLAAFERDRGTQIAVLLLPSTLPEDIDSYTQRVGDSWKIGRKGVGDGLLMVVAKNDRRVRIATAKTLEGAIPDLAARRIIDEAITPRFKAGDFAGGLNAATDQAMALIRGENLPAPVTDRGRGDFGAGGFQDLEGALPLLVFAIFFVPVVSGVAKGFLGRKLGSLAAAGGAGWLVWFVIASLGLAVAAGVLTFLYSLLSSFASPVGRRGRGGRAGMGGPVILNDGSGFGGGFGGGGGGLSSGGGGDFGGGGASGDW